jgi:hypothetical protein
MKQTFRDYVYYSAEGKEELVFSDTFLIWFQSMTTS